MAASEGSELQYSMRIGDTVLLYAKEVLGYVFSEVSSSLLNSVAVGKCPLKEPNLPNVHFATFKVIAANKYKAQERLLNVERLLKGHEPTTTEKGLKLQAEKDLESELKENELEQDRLQGASMVYGETIQLMHVLSKKYLYVSTTHTSRTENTNLRVELCAANAEGCIFKILPRYKVRSVGDEVRYNDQVKLESVKTEGQFLHCSARLFRSVGFMVHPTCHEVNLSATESALTVIPHYRPMPDHSSQTFRASGTVRLFHREYECYIAAEGSFAEQPPVVEDVHCRKRHSDHGILKAPSTSANTYWQFEKESDPRSGGPLSWGERVRIKHMPTRCYLSVIQYDGGYKVSLVECLRENASITGLQADLETVFSLFPVIQEGDAIQVGSYARIKHLQTRTWLHLEKLKPYIREHFDPRAPGLKGLEWDSAELFMLSATETMNYDDAFTLEQVEEPLLDKFNYVAGAVTVLTSYIKQREDPTAPPLDSRRAYSVASTLDELAQFMLETPNARDTKDKQKLLRNLRVLELVIKTLGFFKLDAPDCHEQRKICKACYLVIENYLKGDSRKNENYLARFIEFFQTQVRMGLNAEEVMIEMVEDNDAIVSKMAESEIDYMIQQFVETKDPRFMDFLGNLCVCAGRPIPKTQNNILEKLVKRHGEDVFYKTAVGGTDFLPEGQGIRAGVVYFKEPRGTWQELSSIAARVRVRTVAKESEEREFLESQLQLFGKMCKGNNTTTISALDKDGLCYVTFREAITCVRDEALHPDIRSKYVELITVMFVDVGENRAVLENLSLSFIYDEMVEDPYADTGADDITALTGVKNEYFPDMKEWIKDYISAFAEKNVVASEEDDNNLLAEVLRILSLLVKYGYYDDPEDVDDVLQPLTTVLKGLDDLPFPASEAPPPDAPEEYQQQYKDQVDYFRKEGRFKESTENGAVFIIKERAMEVMDLFFNFRFYVRLQRFIFDFRQLRGDVEEEQEQDSRGRLISAAAFLPSASGKRPPTDLAQLQDLGVELLENPTLVQLARDRLRFIFSISAYFFEKPEYTSSGATLMQDILLDLANYDSNALVQDSLHLLNRFYSSEVTLFSKAIQTQLLVTDRSKEVFQEIGELLPTLRRHLSIEIGNKERGEIIDILEKFTDMCVLEEEESEPHAQNQRILYNYGVFSDVLSYALKHGKGASTTVATEQKAEDEDTPKPKEKPLLRKRTSRGARVFTNELVFVKCFQFLKALAAKNLEVQQRLYDRMNDLLEIDVAVPYMAEVLTEVFTGGPEISLKVREDQVERLFHLVATGGEEGRAELIITLQAMAKVEELDLPVKRNQAFIIKFFSKTREKFCDHVLGEGRQEDRWALLVDAPDEDPDLQLLLTMTDMLAACSEGENLFIESVCQTVFTVRELLRILSSPFLPPERKRPFARFLVWVYINTGGDKIQTGASELSSSPEMWEYLDHLNTLMENMEQVMRAMPDSEEAYVREGLSPSSRSYSVSSKSRRRRPRTQSQAVPFVTGEDGKLLPGLLLYFAEGILPLLKSYFMELFAPPRTGADRERQLGSASNILASLLNLSEAMTRYFTLDTHVKLYRGTVMTMIRSGNGDIPITAEEKVVANFEAKTQHWGGTTTRAREHYRTTYAAEVELNDIFNKFVSNYRLAYQGPNNPRAQIGSKYDSTEYSDFLDDQMMKPGDEYLPLGPSFQEHVSCFANRQAPNADQIVKPVAERLLAQLQISFSQLEDLDETERSRQDELDIKCLQILRAIIHNEIMLIDPELKEDFPVVFRKRCTTRLHPVQNTIQGFDNAVARVVPLLSHPNDEIVREVLAFLKAILYSGNHHVQKGMEHLLTTREERLFSTMQALLGHAAITYKERRALLAQMGMRTAEEAYLQDSFSTLRQTGEVSEKWAASGVEEDAKRRQVHWRKSKPETVKIEIEVTDGGMATEVIPLDSVVKSTEALLPAKREDRAHSPQPYPLLSPKHAHSASDKDKPRRKRSSGRPLVDQALNLFKQNTAHRRPSEGQEQKVDPYAGIDKETAELLCFQDSAHIKLALKVLGLMCDGQYRLMQNYLREQKDNIHNINVVGDVALFIQHFLNDINAETMELVHLILQTLIEMCVGNYPNQHVIYNRQIIDVINRILQLDIADHEKHGYSIQDSVNLKASAVELLEAMLEETSEKTKELVLEVHGALDRAAMYDTLVDFYDLMRDPEVIAESFDDEAERGLFRTYHVLVHFADYPGLSLDKLAPGKDAGKDVCAVWEFCKRRSKSIEVFYRNMEDEKILTKVHFQFDPVNELREEVIEKVKWNVNRDSAEDKLRDFTEWLYAVKKDTIHNNWLYKHWPTRILISYPRLRYYILLFLSLLLNIFVLISFGLRVGDRRENTSAPPTWPEVAGAIRPNVQEWFSDVVLYVFGAIHLFFSLWMFLEYFVVNWPNFILPRFFYHLVNLPNFILPNRLKPKVKPPDETYSDINIFGLRTVYVIAFLLASILSLPLWGYFYCLCLLHVVINNDILQRVLRSVTKNGKSLIWVAILGAVILYIYAVISFAFLHESFDPDNNDGNLYCENLWQCFISVIRYGLIDNIGLIIPLVPEQYEVMGLRLLFDVSFFIIITTIGLNIVFGIIVDTFSELRDERFRTEQDKKAFCFICSLPNHEFERRAKGFDHHVKYDHNMWTYIYYSIYLDTIDTSDHNAIESFVYTAIHGGQLEFFPLLAALALEKEEDTTAQQLMELKSMVQHVLARFKEEEHEKARRKKRDEQKKWEDLNLKQTSFEMSLDGRRSSAFPHQASIDRRPSFEPPPTFDTTFHP